MQQALQFHITTKVLNFSIFKGPFGSRIRRGGEERGGILMEGRGGEGREDILIKNVFGLQREGRGRDFKIILLFYP